ncbi:thioredoxin domain-containing protein, partial [Mycobacterium gordonae]|uniref:thioredoxin domain-containing protein n=1 Tax=Mycobacterium gordonae TaxID=1778 RepID=UPI001E3C6F7D
HPDVIFAKVDTEAEQELAAAAQIRSIPTLMAFKKGQLLFNQALPPARARRPSRSCRWRCGRRSCARRW